MKKYFFTTILLAIIYTDCNSVNKSKHLDSKDVIVSKEGVREFKLDTPISRYDMSKYLAVIDTSALLSEDETDKTLGKKIFLSKSSYLIIWLRNDTINRIDIDSDGFSTADNIKIGMHLKDLFFLVKKENYQFEDEYGLKFCIPTANILYEVSIPDSVDLTIDEYNNLYKHKLSIDPKKLEMLIVTKIIVSHFLDNNTLKISNNIND
jgi:hypothetical protein